MRPRALEVKLVQRTERVAGVQSPVIVACIPALNEGVTIAGIIVQTRKYVDTIIVCDDGSADLTWEIAEALGAIVLRHDVNLGKGAAVKTAFKYASQLNPDVTIMIDADGQHDPNDIPKLIEPILKKEKDFVVGSRYLEGSESDLPFYRKLGLGVINYLGSKGRTSNVDDTQSGFRAFSREALEIMLDCESDGFGCESEQLKLAFDNGLRVGEVPVKIRYSGLVRTSTKHPFRHGSEILSTILRLVVEERPLSLLGLPGLLISIFGISFGMYFLWWFNETRYFSLPMAMITTGALLLGTMLIITSLILYTLTRGVTRARANNNRTTIT